MVLASWGCASGKPQPAEQVDASEQQQADAANIDPMIDAPKPPQDTTPPPPDAQVVVTPDACVPMAIEHLVNPVFDLNPPGTGWVDGRDPATNMLAGGPFPIISANPTGVAAQSAPNKAWFGGAAGSDVSPAKPSLTDTLYQDITFPAGATNFVVSGYYLVGTNETGTTVYDTFTIDIVQTNGTVIENVLVANNTTVAGAFTPFSKTLAANLAGQTVRLRALSINDSIYHTNFFLDSFSFKATHCP